MSIADKFEIMAPVGSRESLSAALKAGAGSVYFGIGKLNMRSHSANAFTIDDLKEIAQICHENNVKSYLTVNTVIYGEDIPTMHEIVDAAVEAGISAIIACDIAVMMYCRQKGMEVHLSTQLNISNIEALKFYAQFADVVVLARELNLTQVSEIHRQIVEQNICGPNGQQVRIEMFCHGALCMAISGKCYMSLDNANRSANRGECIQICRRSYTVTDNETGSQLEIDNKYIMSPKDLKTIRFIDKMMEAGVSVFKIEGRARGPEYVSTVVSCYREAIEKVQEFKSSRVQECKSSNDKVTEPTTSNQQPTSIQEWDTLCDGWDERLKTVFNRGFWDGYYLGQKLGEWSKNYGSSATEKKVYVAKGVRYFSKLGVAEFKMEAGSIHKGDKLLITGPTTGAIYLTASEIRYELEPVDEAVKGQSISIPVPEKVRPSDKLYILVKNDN